MKNRDEQLDEEERQILQDYERGVFERVQNFSAEKEELECAARNTLKIDKRIRRNASSAHKSGMTRFEVLALLVATVVFVLLLIPSMHRPMDQPGTGMLSNGRGIYQAIFVAQIEERMLGNEINLFPSLDEEPLHDTSTAYFRWLMEEAFLSTDLGAFSASQVSRAENLESFSAENNAWSVVTDLSTQASHSQDPVLISRNLNEMALTDWAGNSRLRLENVGSRGDVNTHIAPFDDRFLVVITIGGGGQIIERKHMLWKNLNPNSLTNPILNP